MHLHKNFEYLFLPKIENLVFLMHDDHIIFAADLEKGVDIGICFE